MRYLLLIALLAIQVSSHTPYDCFICQSLAKGLQEIANSKLVLKGISIIVTELCSKYLYREVCEGYVHLYGPAYVSSLSAKYLSPDRICSKIKACAEPQFVVENFEKYQAEVLQDMPAINPWPKTGNDTFFVLQITDIHLDFLYQPGSQTSNCNSPLCCRNGEGNAGYWGTRAVCDLPPQTLLAFLQDFKQYNISFVVWTGDNSPHDQWNYDIDQVLNYTKTITKWFKEYIDVPVFPVIGNHDCFPMDFFNPGHEQILIGNLSEWWEGWLSPEEIQEFSINGFYSALEPNTGFRVIGINNILGDNLNIYLVPNNTDPSQMLGWLRNELYQAEKNNEPVIIIGHIPNGDKFLDSDWARHYRVIVNRFQNIIRGQFFGHTHYDEFTVVNSIIPNTKNPGVIHTAPAFTTHSYINPSFRLYEYDWETKHLVNIHQYRLPLNQVNQGPSEAVFEKAYDYKELYKMTDMSPSSFELVAEQVLNDAGFAKNFYENWLSQYPDEAGQCDEKCQKSLYCRLTSDVFNEAVTCDVDNKSSYLLYRVLEAWQGPWEYISE